MKYYKYKEFREDMLPEGIPNAGVLVNDKPLMSRACIAFGRGNRAHTEMCEWWEIQEIKREEYERVLDAAVPDPKKRERYVKLRAGHLAKLPAGAENLGKIIWSSGSNEEITSVSFKAGDHRRIVIVDGEDLEEITPEEYADG